MRLPTIRGQHISASAALIDSWAGALDKDIQRVCIFRHFKLWRTCILRTWTGRLGPPFLSVVIKRLQVSHVFLRMTAVKYLSNSKFYDRLSGHAGRSSFTSENNYLDETRK